MMNVLHMKQEQNVLEQNVVIFQKKGSLITKNSCYYIDSEVCLEYTFEKCHNVKTRKHCERKQCCTIGKKGDFERLIECKFEGREHCKETFFEKCKTINSGIYGRSVCTLKKRCCKYSLKGDVQKKNFL